MSIDTSALLGGLAPGDSVGLAHTIIGVDASAGLTLWLRGPHGGVQVDIFPHASRQAGVMDTRHFRLSYRGEIPTSDGKALCAEFARVIAATEDTWVSSARAEARMPGRIRAVRGGAALQLRITGNTRFHALNPYVGCLIGCSFCYAQGQLQPWRSLLGLARAGWGSWVDVRVGLPAQLRLELATAARLPIKMTPIVSDPYQAIETRERITRGCLQVLAETPNPPPVMLCTRSALVLEDLPLLTRIPGLRVGMSIPTMDAAVCRQLEPGAAAPAVRLETLATLRAAGVETFAVAQPMLPGDVDTLADALARVANSVTLDTLHGTYAASPHFEQEPLRSAAAPAWQQERLLALRDALSARDVPLWRGELPYADMSQ